MVEIKVEELFLFPETSTGLLGEREKTWSVHKISPPPPLPPFSFPPPPLHFGLSISNNYRTPPALLSQEIGYVTADGLNCILELSINLHLHSLEII